VVFFSFLFLLFFVLVFSIYYMPLKEKTRGQNWLLLFSSYLFYGLADLRMLPLLLIATVVFYSSGIIIHKTRNEKRSSWLTILSVVSGIGLLLYFKYLNFFINSFNSLFVSIGFHNSWATYNIIFPLGVSFYTFKLISYIIEIHRGKIEPERDFEVFAAYIAFFPTIISGPIDRPNDFLPQLHRKRSFDYDLVVDGCRQVLWGILKKVVLADNLAELTGLIWSNVRGSSGSTLLLGAIFFSFQIYADFSGYSDMAIGIGKILGFRITKNFSYPFFATNIAEYWRRWHISLTSWLTDYVFMPLNIRFRNLGNWGIISAVIINMIVIGLWHGANWTFAVFGLYHGLLFIPLILTGAFLRRGDQISDKSGMPRLRDLVKMAWTFMLVTIGLVFFRSDTVSQAISYISGIFSPSLFTIPEFNGIRNKVFLAIIIVVIFILVEWKGREKQYPLYNLGIKWKRPVRWLVYFFIIFLLGMFMHSQQMPFIYFKF